MRSIVDIFYFEIGWIMNYTISLLRQHSGNFSRGLKRSLHHSWPVLNINYIIFGGKLESGNIRG